VAVLNGLKIAIITPGINLFVMIAKVE